MWTLIPIIGWLHYYDNNIENIRCFPCFNTGHITLYYEYVRQECIVFNMTLYSICMPVYVCIILAVEHTHVHTRTHECTHTHAWMHTHTHMYTYARTRTHTYTCAQLHAHMYTHLYTHTQLLQRSPDSFSLSCCFLRVGEVTNLPSPLTGLSWLYEWLETCE